MHYITLYKGMPPGDMGFKELSNCLSVKGDYNSLIRAPVKNISVYHINNCLPVNRTQRYYETV